MNGNSSFLSILTASIQIIVLNYVYNIHNVYTSMVNGISTLVLGVIEHLIVRANP